MAEEEAIEQQTIPCSPDDVACQEEVLSRLKNLQELTQDDSFPEKYPHLVGLENTIDEAVQTQEVAVQRVVDECAEAEPQEGEGGSEDSTGPSEEG